MKKLFSFLKRKYQFGLKWYVSSGIEEEFIAQVFYIQALICGLRILYEIKPEKILGYIIFAIFAINTLPIDIFYRFIISVGYVLFIPFIIVMADDGMSFYEAMF